LADVGASFSPASLFAAGEPGVWYDPSDFSTMFQDSGGTTPVTAVEQPVGLLLDKSQGLVLGPELVTSGIFAAPLTVSNGVGANQAIGTVAGVAYRISYRITAFSGGGNTRLSLGTTGIGLARTSTGTYSEIILTPAGSSPSNVYAFISVSTSATIDNISVREMAGNHATQATSASRPVLSARVNLLTKTEQFEDAVWVKTESTVVANAVVAPDGTTTAEKLVESTTASAVHYVDQANTVVSGTVYTSTVYLQKAERTKARLYYTVSNFTVSILIDVDLTAGTVSAVTVNGIATSNGATITAAGNDWYRVSLAGTLGTQTAGFLRVATVNDAGNVTYTGDGTSGIYVWGADLRVTNDGMNLPLYQRVNTSTDYDTTGFPYYLRFDGSDDSMATNTITPGIDKAQVFAGVRKLSDAAQGVVAEMSATIASNNGTFLLAAPDAASATFAFDSKGTTQVDAIASSLTAPLTRVVTGIGDISGDTAIIRINGVQADQETSDQGTGNYLAYPLYLGRRNNATLPLNGRIYSLITRFGANLDVVTINNTEVYVSGKMGGGYVSPITGYDFLVDANGDQITDASNNPLFTQALYT
jgi:hypothetical protein